MVKINKREKILKVFFNFLENLTKAIDQYQNEMREAQSLINKFASIVEVNKGEPKEVIYLKSLSELKEKGK